MLGLARPEFDITTAKDAACIRAEPVHCKSAQLQSSTNARVHTLPPSPKAIGYLACRAFVAAGTPLRLFEATRKAVAGEATFPLLLNTAE